MCISEAPVSQSVSVQDTHINTHTYRWERRGPFLPRCLTAAQVCCRQIRLMVGGKRVCANKGNEWSCNITQDVHTHKNQWSTAPGKCNPLLSLSVSYTSIFSQRSEHYSSDPAEGLLAGLCRLNASPEVRTGSSEVLWPSASSTQTCGREAGLCYSQGLSHAISLPFISSPTRRSVI